MLPRAPEERRAERERCSLLQVQLATEERKSLRMLHGRQARQAGRLAGRQACRQAGALAEKRGRLGIES